MEKYRRRPNTSCSVCKTAIYRRPGQIENGPVFCSQKCVGLSQRKQHLCVVCRKVILAGQNKKTCSRRCANIHRTGIRYGTGARKDKVKYQRGLKLCLLKLRPPVCERCGYARYEILNVHHKDRNRKHNEFSNLELLCPNCHAEEHYLDGNWFSGRIPSH